MPKQSISDFLKPQTTTPVSTNVHSNIDNLIVQSKLDEFDRYGSMRTTPLEYKGGVDDVVANIAMNPMMTLKSLGSIGKKLLQKTGLRNPVSHYTTGRRAGNIVSEGRIKGTEREFPGKPFKEEPFEKKLRDLYGEGARQERSPAVSVTRDPKFLSRPHKHVGTDVRFVMDRDEMIKKGLKIQPISIGGFKKSYDNVLNPKFEFEERVRGNIPIENVKLIDLIRFLPNTRITDIRNQELIKSLTKSNIPTIKSQTAYNQLLNLNKKLTSKNWRDNVSQYNFISNTRENVLKYIDKLLDTPTYKFDPFKR